MENEKPFHYTDCLVGILIIDFLQSPDNWVAFHPLDTLKQIGSFSIAHLCSWFMSFHALNRSQPHGPCLITDHLSLVSQVISF